MKTVTCIDKDKNTYDVKASELSWRQSAYGIIIHDRHILLVPQGDGYDLPGGGIELGETIESGIIREVREETGLEGMIVELIDCKTSFFRLPIPEEKYIQGVMLYYTINIIGGELSVDGFDDEEKTFARLAEWIPLNEIENIKFKSSINIIPIIQKAIQ